MTPLEHAIRLYNQRGEQFADLIPWHTVHGIVVIDPACVLLAFHADSRDLLEVADPAQADTLFITYLGGDLTKAPVGYADRKFIAYERIDSRGRFVIHPTEKLLRKLKLTRPWDQNQTQ